AVGPEPRRGDGQHTAATADVEDRIAAPDSVAERLEEQAGRRMAPGAECRARVDLYERAVAAGVLRPGKGDREPSAVDVDRRGPVAPRDDPAAVIRRALGGRPAARAQIRDRVPC